MQDILEIIKVTGPAIGIAITIAIALWKENGQLQQKIFELYERRLQEQKGMTALLLQAQDPSSVSGPRSSIADRYIAYLTERAGELQAELARLRPAGSGQGIGPV